MSARRARVRSGRNVGLDVRGWGNVAASSAACSSLSREAGTPKYAPLAASTPQGELESQGGDRLLRLADRTARGREVQILGELLGDGARAAYPVAMPHRCREAGPESAGVVHAQGIRNFRGVDPVMCPEPGVLANDDHALEERGHVGKRKASDGETVGLGASASLSDRPTVRCLSHHCRAARPVIPPPHRWRPDADQPHEHDPAGP